jgi:hypothetical protein
VRYSRAHADLCKLAYTHTQRETKGGYETSGDGDTVKMSPSGLLAKLPTKSSFHVPFSACKIILLGRDEYICIYSNAAQRIHARERVVAKKFYDTEKYAVKSARRA